MKNIKNTIAATTGLSLLAISNVALAASNWNWWTSAWLGASDFYKSNDGSRVTTSTQSFDQVIVTWIWWISGFLYLAAVIMGLWGAYNILTAGGDEEKVKKGKDIIIRAVLWIIAVFSVSIIMNFAIKALFNNTATA